MALGVIFSSFFSALGQFWDPRFRRVLFLGLGLTFGLLVLAYFGLLSLFSTFGLYGAADAALGADGWGTTVVNATGLVAILILSIFLMVPVASAFTSLFLDRVAQAVEDKHYPYLAKATPVPFGEALKDTVNFLGILVAANVFALLLYLVFPPFAPMIFWGLNGFLLGREYFFIGLSSTLLVATYEPSLVGVGSCLITWYSVPTGKSDSFLMLLVCAVYTLPLPPVTI